jgi:predicted GNAT family acetyltransferase
MIRKPYFATLEDGGRVRLVAVRTPPRGLVVSTCEGEPPDLGPLAEDLRRRGDSLPGVSGPTNVALRFAESWASANGIASRVRLRFKVLELSALIAPRWPAGELRLATEDDAGVLAEWTNAFIDETGLPEEDRIAASAESIVRRIRNGHFRLRTAEGTPMTMAVAIAGSIARIGGVYTPPARRNRGYASACVARLSQSLLDDGARKVTLSTDASNPTSNKIYEALGYRHISDAVMISFESA